MAIPLRLRVGAIIRFGATWNQRGNPYSVEPVQRPAFISTMPHQLIGSQDNAYNSNDVYYVVDRLNGRHADQPMRMPRFG